MSTSRQKTMACLTFAFIAGQAPAATAADKALLDILLQNGVITTEQHEQLMSKPSLSSEDILPAESNTVVQVVEEDLTPTVALTDDVQSAIDKAVADLVADASPLRVSHGSKGLHFETRDGLFSTDLQFRAQMRYSNLLDGDPRQLSQFDGDSASSFEPRRLRMKIGGHGFQPWLKYYFELDMQPARDVEDSSSSASARIIDYRIDIAKWDWGGVRLGQWKVDLNRERVDSSGRQQFVERSIVNRVFTVDRQVGVQLRGRLFEGTSADLNYYAGIFNGEGRGVVNNNGDHLYMGRLQWNFNGRELAWKQTDVEYTERPTGSFALAGFTNTGPCTRWSSSGCGNLDGYLKPAVAAPDQYEIVQGVQEFAFKYRGFSFQQEFHRKSIKDTVEHDKVDMDGFYLQTGYFFHNMFDSFPAPLELAARYASVEEPNKVDRAFMNEREEFTVGANWFFSGHNNKVTVDFSHLTLDDGLLNESASDNRIRLQWDVSF